MNGKLIILFLKAQVEPIVLQMRKFYHAKKIELNGIKLTKKEAYDGYYEK